MKWRLFFVFPIILFVIGCNNGIYSASNKKYKQQTKALAKQIRMLPAKDDIITDSVIKPKDFIGTVNFGLRKPNFVIIHHTAQQSCEKTLLTFTKDSTKVSAHYVICKDGTTHHMLNNYLRAWHAGASRWGNVTDLNSTSIGIELDNNGTETFSDAQIKALMALLIFLKTTYNIPASNFLAHSDIAPGRKVDPSKYFPWQQLAEKGFGTWYGDTTNLVVPESFNAAYALRIIGYNINAFNAAVQSFRLHYLQTENTGELTEPEKKIMYALMLKFL